MDALLVEPTELLSPQEAVVFDCRFSLADPGAGLADYQAGHVPGAHYLDLDRHLSGARGRHGGRHPLPDPAQFCELLGGFGVCSDTAVIAYDDSRLAFAARLWWLMHSLGYRPPRLLNGGYRAWLAAGGEPQQALPRTRPRAASAVRGYSGVCDIDGLCAVQAAGALLVDAREPRRYQGVEEPIDPVAGHIPGAVNRPWQGVTDDEGRVREPAAQRSHWGDALDAQDIVVYCGSGVTACVDLFSLALLDREGTLYAGSWSDWCSYLEPQGDDSEKAEA